MRNFKKSCGRIGRILLVLCALLLFTGCASETDDDSLQALLPRENVTEITVRFMNEGLGDNIPQLQYASGEEEFTRLSDLLYSAAAVQVEIPTSYSPELNASHVICLTTQAGTMTAYYDDYQGLLNVPINRKSDDTSVRVYLSFQTTELGTEMETLSELLPEPEPVQEVETQVSDFPPDDSALRATLDLTAVGAEGTAIAFEQASCLREQDSAVYYVYNASEKTELPQDKVLVAAIPESTEIRQAAIASITENDTCIRVTVALVQLADGEEPVPTAVLCDRADFDKGKPVCFVDESGSLLYAQTLTLPEITQTEETEVVAETQAEYPSDAAGGEEGDGEPLEP